MEDDSNQSLLRRFKTLVQKKAHLGRALDLNEEIHGLMNEGQANGLISDEESDMVQGVLDLKETTAHSIMIPRTEMSSASINTTVREVITLITEGGHTRIPIYKDNLDEIMGVLHAKDILKLWGQDPDTKIPTKFLRKPCFVPENQKISEVFKVLKGKQTHLAIVTDEYGGSAGIITIEDILEEIVGEILDEHDDDRSLLTVLDDHTVTVDARLEVENLEEHFHIKIPEGEFESVGGFIIHLAGHIPKTGEVIVFGDLRMKIEAADSRKIDKIRITHRPRHLKGVTASQ